MSIYIFILKLNGFFCFQIAIFMTTFNYVDNEIETYKLFRTHCILYNVLPTLSQLDLFSNLRARVYFHALELTFGVRTQKK